MKYLETDETLENESHSEEKTHMVAFEEMNEEDIEELK